MLQLVFLIFSALAFSSNSVFAKDEFEEAADECLKEYGLKESDLEAVSKTGDVSTIDACFWGCYLKKLGYLNDKGEYDPNGYLANLKKYMADDDVKAEVEKQTHKCDSLKDAVVSDGEAGCEMGALLAACLMDHTQKEKP